MSLNQLSLRGEVVHHGQVGGETEDFGAFPEVASHSLGLNHCDRKRDDSRQQVRAELGLLVGSQV